MTTKTAIDFTIDLETNRRAPGIGKVPLRNIDGSIIVNHKLSEAEALIEQHIVPSQVAYIDHASGKMTAVTIDNIHTPDRHNLDINHTYDINDVFKGNEVKAKLHSAQVQTRSDINRLFMKKNSKGKVLTQSQQDYFYDKVYPTIKKNTEKAELFYEQTLANNRKLVYSHFSRQTLQKEASVIQTKSVNSVINRISLDTAKSGVWEWEAFKNQFVNEFAGTIIAAAKNRGIVNIGAWNAQFESERIAGWIHNYADPKIRKQWLKLVNNDKIRFVGMESSYLDVLWGLSKHNDEIIKSSLIPMNASMFQEFGYRAGMTPRTKQEFEAAVSWKQENVVEAVSGWLKPAQQLAGEAHFAPIDTLRADDIKTFFDKVNDQALKIARAREAANPGVFVDPNTVMHDAFKETVLGEGYAASAAESEDILDSFIKTVSRQNKTKSGFTKNIMSSVSKFGGSGGGGGPKGPLLEEIIGGFKGKGFWRYGSLAAAAGLAIAATFFETNDFSNNKYGSSFGKVGKLETNKTIRQFDEYDDGENGPFIFGHAGKAAMWTAATAGSLALVGLREAKLRGNLLGVVDKFDIKTANAGQMLKQAGKLIRTGVNVVEGHFPITRVFKAGAAIDYLTNVGKINQKNAKIRKVLNVPLHNTYAPETVGSVNIDSFMDHALKTNQAEAETLRDLISNRDRLRGLKKSSVIMSRAPNGKTIVKVVDVAHDGTISNPIFGKNGQSFDVDSVFLKTRRANLAGRNINPGVRKVDDTYHNIRNSLAEDFLATEQTRVGLTQKRTFEEFFSQFKKPSYMNEEVFKGYKYLQYMLELGPKGIHMGNNIFTIDTNNLGKVKTVVGVKGISSELEGSFMQNIKAKMQYYGQFGREYIQAGNRFLESPFEMLVHPETITRAVNNLKGSNSPIKQIAGNILGKLENTHLGLNLSHMKYGTLEYVAKFGLKRVLPLGVGYYGIKTIDSLLGGAMFSPTGKGPITTGISSIYQTAALAYSKISDITGLTRINKNQERIAPGSTGLGIFAFPSALAGTYTVANMIYSHSPKHAKGVMDRFGKAALTGNINGYKYNSLTGSIISKFNKLNVVQEALRPEAYAGALNKSFGARVVSSFIKSPKRTLFGIGMAMMAPFVLGALGSSKTYQEREAEFQGQKDVAIRKNRGWMLSSGAFQGGSVGQYRQHGLYIHGSNYENRGVVWPSYSSRLLHAMTFGMANRYVLEEYHKEDQPVYETSPYGASVPVIGPLISQTIGRVLKPVRRMHEGYENGVYQLRTNDNYSDNYKYIAQRATAEFMQLGTSSTYNVATNQQSTNINDFDVKSVGGHTQAMAQLRNNVADLVGFKGFALETVIRGVTGKSRPDEYVPYLKSAQEMYNPAQYMWQYDSGDFSVIGGEFLRRGLVNPRKRWEINDIPNELYGQDWIPKRFHQGTTFDKMPMGWLYASRKGWEFTYPEVKGLPLEQYPDEIKLDILKYMAPQSSQFKTQLKRTTEKAIQNKLSPFDEQRAYDAAEQAAEIKKKVWAHSKNQEFELEMQEIQGRITSMNLSDMTFTVDETGDKKYRLAGVTAEESHIRAGLLKKNHYSSAEDLSADAKEIQEDIINRVNGEMQIGSAIKFKTPGGGSISGGTPEAVVGGLNKDLLSLGSPLHDTGNVSQFNMTQGDMPIGAGLLSKYWNALTNSNNVFKNKLLGNRDYITKYENDRVYNMPVKLWSRPIEHFLKPLIAATFDSIGIHITPSFTKERRKNEQYWDVIKYIKYKTLATKAEYSHDGEAAAHYRQLADTTMVGSDPINNPGNARAALPVGDKDYFEFFANEPDPKRRGKIFGLLSSPQKRIYNAIWTSKVANSGKASSDELEKYKMLKDTGGYEVDDSIISDWKNDTGEQSSLKDYVRARYVQEFAKHNNLPGSDWAGYDERVNIDNVELMSLDKTGFQVEDYGYFDEQKRSAAYDKMAYVSAQEINSSHLTRSEFIGNILPALVSGSQFDMASGMPTTSPYPIQSSTVDSDRQTTVLHKKHSMPAFSLAAIDDIFIAGSKMLRF